MSDTFEYRVVCLHESVHGDEAGEILGHLTEDAANQMVADQIDHCAEYGVEPCPHRVEKRRVGEWEQVEERDSDGDV